MREIRIKVPEQGVEAVVHLLQRIGVERAGVYREFVHGPDRWEAVVSVETSTPEATKIIEALQRAPFYDRATHTLTVREIRAIASSRPAQSLTVPLEAPHIDVDQELWQFCQVTYGHLGRVVVAALLIAYAMIRGSTLLMAGGLLFLPALPHLLAVGRGLCERDRHLLLQGVVAFLTTILLVSGCGILVALLVPGPMKFDDFLSPAVAACVSVGIGSAGALASLDDVGKRELIGLATAAQVGIVPTWFGVSVVHGFDTAPGARLLSYLANLAIIVTASAIVFGLVRHHRRATSQAPARRES
jgi:hypothetical protein